MIVLRWMWKLVQRLTKVYLVFCRIKIYPKSCYLYFLLLYPGPNHHHLPLRFLRSPSNCSLYSPSLPLTGYSQNSGQKGPGRDIFQIMQCLLKTLQWLLIPLQAKISFTSADRRCFSHHFFFFKTRAAFPGPHSALS